MNNTDTDTNTNAPAARKIVRKPQPAARVSPKPTAAQARAQDTLSPAEARALVQAPPKAKAVKAHTPAIKSLSEIKAEGGRRSVEAAIKSELTKLDKSARAVITSYCAIGGHLATAKAAIEAAGQSWKVFMTEGKPLGIAYSTAQRYLMAHEFGSKRMLEQYDTQGAGALNFKALLDDTKQAADKAEGKAPNANRKPKASTPSVVTPSTRPAAAGGDDLPLGPITDARVDAIMDMDVPRLTLAQATRLVLAIREHIEELQDADRVIEGESDAA